MNGDLTVFNKTLISTKDHLKVLETVNATVYNKNGAFNLQGLLVNSSQSVTTFTKLNNAFKAYNGNLSKSTDLQNAIYEVFNTNNRKDFSAEDMIRQIMPSIGIEDIESEMAKYYNKYGYFQSEDFWNEYADIISENIEIITNSLSADNIGLDDTVFE